MFKNNINFFWNFRRHFHWNITKFEFFVYILYIMFNLKQFTKIWLKKIEILQYYNLLT